MRASGTFSVVSFVPATVSTASAETAPVPVETALPVGVSTMEKQYQGEVAGRSTTVFTAAYDMAAGVGTYLAMESFEGTLGGHKGAFNFVHSATTTGGSREAQFFALVPASGTGELAGITGTGGMAIDADGTHRIWFDYELASGA
ncbi:DUF3224 domain-containing protein [Streptacidiphilus rugosus]|uniref:DUF3224 domain-containing protein n=1 Tax=Streptacidiphilus rugosus TaxID=405783 RepID=UPI000568A7DE|nr:DUF3224 domain-containing protein [Streptacidiphilus rugosus]